MRKQSKFWKRNGLGILKGVAILLLLYSMTACYSFRLTNQNGTGVPDPFHVEEGFYQYKEVHVIDTVLKLKPEEKIPMLIETCETGGFHTIEVKHTMGGILLSAVTFGRRRRVKVKYVCLKPLNEND